MKKFSLALATMAVALGAYSCGDKGGSSSMSTERDSVAYAIGLMQADGLLQQNANVDAANKVDSIAFLKGLREGLKDSTLLSYAQGLTMGVQMSKFCAEDSINTKLILEAFEAKVKGDTAHLRIPDSLKMEILQSYGQKRQAREMEKQYGANKEKGAEYKAKFMKEEGVKVTPSGLVYKVEKQGTGATPTLDDKVVVKYKGTTISGETFDENDKGFETSLSQVVKGWTEMLQLMKVGDKVKVVIPYELAYGENGTYGIEPYSTLVFEIELLEVKKDAAKKDATSAATASTQEAH